MNEYDTKRPEGTPPLPVVVLPDPMLEERAGPFRTTLMGLGGAFVVIMVLYGLSRPPEPQAVASAPQAAAQNAPAPAQPETTGSGQQASQQGNAKQGDAKQSDAKQAGAKQNGAQPTTTGQGETAKDQPKQPSKQGQTGGEKRSDSATTGKATAPPSDKAQPKQ
jgi:hypothetical protein